MKKLCFLAILLSAAVLLSGCSVSDGIYRGNLVLDGNLVIPAAMIEPAEILLISGKVTISEGGKVRGNIYQLMGELAIDGTVEGNITQLNGSVRVGPKARILGDFQTGGGEVIGDLEKSVTGKIYTSPTRIPLSLDGLRQTISREWTWAVAETMILTLLALFLGWSLPGPLQRTAQAIREYPVVCGAMGLLVVIVGLCLLVQMVFTVLLIPLSLLGVILFALSIATGWLGFGVLTGKWLAQRFNFVWSASVVAGSGTLVFMATRNLLELLPGLGAIFSIASAIIGLGAVFQTRFGLRRFQPAGSILVGEQGDSIVGS